METASISTPASANDIGRHMSLGPARMEEGDVRVPSPLMGRLPLNRAMFRHRASGTPPMARGRADGRCNRKLRTRGVPRRRIDGLPGDLGEKYLLALLRSRVVLRR